MSEAEKLFVDNLLKAFEEVQRYLVLGLATSVAALALALRRPRPAGRGREGAREVDEVDLTGIPIAIEPGLARAILLVLCMLAGAMASYSAESANVIAKQLQNLPRVLQAAGTYPSLATSPYPGVRYVAACLPLLLSFLALLVPALRAKPVDWTALRGLLLGWFWFFVAAYGSLVLQLRRPIGVP